jgi:hypothetical protein
MKKPLIDQLTRIAYRSGYNRESIDFTLAYLRLKREIGRALHLEKIMNWLTKKLTRWNL